jgi:hypothetical protein
MPDEVLVHPARSATCSIPSNRILLGARRGFGFVLTCMFVVVPTGFEPVSPP